VLTQPPLDRSQVDGVELPLCLDRRRQLAIAEHDMPYDDRTYPSIACAWSADN
jgi:hypothetical protein